MIVAGEFVRIPIDVSARFFYSVFYMGLYLQTTGIFLGSYLVGCLCSAYYLVLWRTGRDLRSLHTGTLGARNCGRVLGPWAFIVSLAFDVTKGFLAVYAAQLLLPESSLAHMAAVFGVLLGHVFPVQLGFEGGKGISVMIGALLLLNPMVLISVGAIAGLALAVLRRSSQAMIFAVFALPIASIILFDDLIYSGGFTIIAVSILFFHKKNISDILKTYGFSIMD